MNINGEIESALNIAIKTSARKYFDKCIKENEIKDMAVLRSIVSNKTFKDYSKYFELVSNEELKEIIDRKVYIEVKKLFNKIESNLNTGTEFIL